ncbi:TonB-dependent receptor [Flavihumibacter sp. UBA7668]|uniref:TonB-dependent receptor n=1 Tax=Flavihumibacter sp. UBA7668 TaxID=1946542 RepID=UPI0025BE7C5B|nr:TonB-dependent receptor [Flavihumibacter sp. UBA7668]
MKLTIALVLVTCLQVTAKTYSQERISVRFSETRLKKALKEIEQQSSYRFVYSSDRIPGNATVTYQGQNVQVVDVLSSILSATELRYKVLANRIVVITNIGNEDQNKTVTGTVRGPNGETLSGATVQVKGSSLMTTTNEAGVFSISVPDNDAVLIISYVDMQPAEFKVGTNSTINIQLKAVDQSMNEVVVVGYGTQKKVSMTSAVTQVKGEDLVRRPVSNLQQALQGQAPGLTVLDRGGEPGRSSATMRVRGTTTFSGNSSGNSSPLIIVDGVEQTMFNLNPEDVESISVLKDASSTAIYGSRAANGVVLITTKRAKSGKVQIAYNGYYAIQKSVNQPENMELEKYMRYQQLAYTNQGLAIPARYTDESIDTWVNSTDRYRYPDVNTWFKTVLKPAPQHSHNISFSGGNEFSRTRVSLRYMDQGGIAPNYSASVREVRINNDMQLHKRLKMSADFNYRYNMSRSPFASDVFNRFFHGTLFAAPKYPDGTYGLSQQGFNPLLIAEQSGKNNIASNYFYTSGKMEYQLLKGLTLSAQVSAVIDFTEQKAYRNAINNFDSLTGRRYQVANNALTETRNRYREITTNYLANYSTSIGRHEIKALAGFSELYNNGYNLTAYRERFYNNEIQSIGQGANDPTKDNTGLETKFGLRSYFARLNYAFDQKYLLEVNGRYDGSSRFTGDNQYSFFPSFSGAWRITEEDFFDNLNTPFSELKIRGSWGQTGNQTVPLYSYFASLSQGSYTFGGIAAPTFSQTVLADPSISWETNTQTDIGLEGSLLGYKLSFGIDYYRKRTSGILLALPLPVVTGFASSNQNAGVIDNKGFEFSLGYRNNEHKLKYSFGANLALNNNKVIDLKGGGPFINSSYDLDPRYIVKEGLPFNSHWGYKTDGFFQSQEEIDNYPTIAPNTKPGDVKYVDLNKDGRINADDWTVIGNPFPKYTFGAVAELSYRNFSLNLLFQGAADVDTRLSGALSEYGIFEGFTHEIVTDNYWTPERPNARFPLPRKSDQRNVNTSDQLIIDGSYLRLKNLQLTYTVPANLLQKAGINGARFYVSGTNLLTFSKLNEWNLDPEAESGRGIYYPQTSLYTLGLNLNF